MYIPYTLFLKILFIFERERESACRSGRRGGDYCIGKFNILLGSLMEEAALKGLKGKSRAVVLHTGYSLCNVLTVGNSTPSMTQNL